MFKKKVKNNKTKNSEKTSNKKKTEAKKEVELTALESMVLDMIKKYAPIKKKDLIQANSMLTDRNVRRTIENLRKKGYTVCNVGNGYFMPKSKTEILSCIEYLQRGISGQLTTIDNMNKGLMTFGKKR